MRLCVLVLLLCACGHSTLEAGPDAPEAVDALPEQHGLRGVYFRDAIDHAAERIDDAIDVAWNGEPAPGVGARGFAVRWTGMLVPPAPGTYGIGITASDGVRVWVDRANVIDAWSDGEHAAFTDVALASPVAIKVTYYARRAGGHITLRWRRPDGTEEVVPASALRPDAVAPELASPPPPYENAVDDTGCADPGAIAVDGTYYVACTGGRFRIRTSRDLVTWKTTDSYILPPGGAPWSSTTEFRWAPEIHAVGTGYVAYFTSADGNGKRAIGAASATSPLGPYTVRATPLVTDPVGVIDPTYFHDDDGKSYLIYKFAGSSVGQPTPIYLRELRADGLAFAPGSTPIELIRNAPTTFEGPLVEAPWMVKHDGTYYLFYSGNSFDEHYRVGVARATSVSGPYTKHTGPILGNNAKWVGPGHNSSVQVDGIDYLVYHAWHATPSGTPDEARGRVLLVDRIDWVNGWPRIDGTGTPSTSARARPGLDPDAN